MSSPTPPDSTLLLHALAREKSAERGILVHEILLAASLGWSLSRLVRVVAAGVEAGYIDQVGASGVRLTEKGRAWVETHPENR